MKKAITILLAMVLCLSLGACGDVQNADTEINGGTVSGNTDTENIDPSESSNETEESSQTYSEEIIITTENWQDYLEVKQAEDWEEDERGCCIVFLLGLKDAYKDKQISTDTELTVEWSGTFVYRGYSCNKETRTCTIGDILSSYSAEEITMTRKFHPNLLNLKYAKDVQAVIVLDGATDFVTYAKILENFEVISADGVIRFE